ncbi:MAG: TraB/GumN family protein [Pyrinomonadaceae bacterium]|nr:TraB/GumN family protein [Pyrinomonadaceae bacterium]
MHKATRFGIIVFAIASLPLVIFSQKAAKAPDTGLLYRISGKGLAKPSYVFGTVHLACPSELLPTDKIKTMIAESDRLVLEVDMDDPAEVASMARALVLPNGKTFRDALTPEQFAKVNEFLVATVGLRADMVQTLSPIALQVLILSNQKVSGCAKPTSYEETLKNIAQAAKKPVEGLETAAFQGEVLAKIPIDVQAKMLYEMAVSPEKSYQQFRELKAAYNAQDSDLLYKVTSSQVESGSNMQVALLDDRNVAWLPKIEALMKEKSSFIAFGAGHLGGETGIITRLRALGYKVEAIRL